MFERIIDYVEKKTGLSVEERSIINVLVASKYFDDFWLIVRHSGEPFNVVAEVIKELVNDGYLVLKGGNVKLSDKGVELLNSLGYGRGFYRCDKCLGKTVLWDELGISKEFKRIAENRPKAIIDYDQGFVTPETTLARIAIMDQNGDLRGKELLILGDDDLVSIAAMLTGFPKRIAVFEIDERLIKFIKKVASELNYDLEVYQHDLRKPLPEEHHGKFDTFFTDPTETLLGLKAFIGRGVSALKGERCAGYFGLTSVESSLYKWRELQKILLNEFNVVITHMIREFNEYVNWDYIEEMSGWKRNPIKSKPRGIWYTSTLYRIETVKGYKGFEDILEGDIYHDEETASV